MRKPAKIFFDPVGIFPLFLLDSAENSEQGVGILFVSVLLVKTPNI